MPTNELMPTAVVARRLGVHVRTVHRFVKAGQITPAVKVPGHRGALLFDPRDVELLALKRENARQGAA